MYVVNPNMWMLTFNVILGTRASYSESSCNFFWGGFQFFFLNPTDRPTQYQETHSTLNEKKRGGAVAVSFPYKDRLVVGTARISCKTKRSRLHGRKTEHFKAITSSNHQLLKSMCGQLVITWNFEILVKGRWDRHCKIKETLLLGFGTFCKWKYQQ